MGGMKPLEDIACGRLQGLAASAADGIVEVGLEWFE